MVRNIIHGEKEHCVTSSGKVAINLTSSKNAYRNIKKLTATKKKQNFSNKWTFYHVLLKMSQIKSVELKKWQMKTIFSAHGKVQHFTGNVKDPNPKLLTTDMYEIPCICGLIYIGQTADQ